MKPAIEMEVDATVWNSNIDRLAGLMGKDLPTVVKQSARRVAVNLARGTAPFGFEESARLQVTGQISKDVSRVFRPLSAVSAAMNDEDRSRLTWLENNAPPSALNAFLREKNTGLEFRRMARPADMQPTRIRGRQPKSQRPRFAAPQEKIDTLITRKQRRAGLAKHGWAMCARLLGGTRGIASWITRSKGKPGAGSVTQAGLASDPAYILENRVPYVSHLISGATIDTALKREGDFIAQEIDRRITRNWK